MNRRINLSIMPTVDSRRRSDLYSLCDVPEDLNDEALGQVFGHVLRHLQMCGVKVGQDALELEVRIF